METTQLVSGYNLLLARGFLNEATCQNIIEQTRLGPFDPAVVYGRVKSGVIDERVRKASRLNPPSTTVEFVKQRLVDYKHDVERHFRISLKDVEDPQFLRYQEGDFFVAYPQITQITQITSLDSLDLCPSRFVRVLGSDLSNNSLLQYAN